jgi:hypothetical protein
MRQQTLSCRLQQIKCFFLQISFALFLVVGLIFHRTSNVHAENLWNPDRAAERMVEYFERMTQPKSFKVCTGKDWDAHTKTIRRRILKDLNLDPLPKRIPLDPHYSDTIDHPWCTIRQVAVQLWPSVYSRCLLLMPKKLPEKPAPAVLCVHGHTADGYADPDEQKRYLTFAKLGYVTFVTPQDHHEDILRGYSYQTYLAWNNMRALDFIESLPEADPKRLGINGLSGGGLQTQIMIALDNRLKAATIAGMTCEYREILFPFATHCYCNHWPNVMSYTDQPEISALGLPAAVQYLTMNDWTTHFAAHNFPTIQTIYRENGYPDRTECVYWPTGHVYDRPKRERTYWWMEKWVRGKKNTSIPAEDDKVPIITPARKLLELKTPVPNERSFEDYVRDATWFQEQLGEGVDGWKTYSTRMTKELSNLLGEECSHPGPNATPEKKKPFSSDIRPTWAMGLHVEEFLVDGKDQIPIPVIILYPPPEKATSMIEIYLSEAGRSVVEKDPTPYLNRIRQGAMIVLPDLRFSGDYSLRNLAGRLRPELRQFKPAHSLSVFSDSARQARDVAAAWDRNGILWGQPVPGMMVHDLRSVITSVESRSHLPEPHIQIITQDTPALALTALFSACLDRRITAIDVDFKGRCFVKGAGWQNDPDGLPVVSQILCHGDILQWSAVLADRHVTLRHLPRSEANRHWLEAVFARLGNQANLKWAE